ncbi:MAG: TonB-dependent receptor plug domain-containing protein [Bacteroidales bacterium]|nr:TonB-dependent receptor plug domain-containing protein [Bacteroidales bacterium]
MRNNWRITLLIPLFLTCLAAKAQDISVRMVSADSLVSVIRSVTGNEIYLAGGKEDVSFYSVSAHPESFLSSALAKLRTNGYSVSEYEGVLYLIRGKSLQAGLPSGWFTKGAKETATVSQESSQTASYLNKIYEIGDERNKRSGMATIHGKVRDAASGEPVIGITVSDKDGKYAMTDSYGDWTLQLPTGRNILTFSGYPMEDTVLEVVIFDNGALDLNMKEKVVTLKAASVSADAIATHRSARLGVERIQLDRIKKLPSAFGESDLIKAVLALPGVQTVGEASSGFNVRGGSVDQNLILFNEGTVYNPNHMFGIFSSFNSDVISEAELYKSSIPASMGGRISSVLDIHTKTGNGKKITGSLGIGLLTGRFSLEGPIIKDRTTFVLAARTTYSNWIMNLLPEESHYHGGKTSFRDFNASLSHKINDRNSLSVYGYYSGDKFSFSSDTTYRYSNMNFAAKLHSVLGDNIVLDLAAGYDSYNSSVEADRQYAQGTYLYSTAISQMFVKLALKHKVAESHTLTYGINGIRYGLMPGKMEPSGSLSIVAYRELDKKSALEPSAFLSDSWKLSEKTALEAGIRLNGLSGNGGSYIGPEFRLSGKYSPGETVTIKAGLNSMRQSIHLVTNTSTISPMDTWVLSGKRIKPQTGYQAAIGLYWTPNPGYDFTLEGYGKKHSGGLDYRAGAILVMNPDLEDDLVTTEGRAYGIEAMIRKNQGKLNGWLSYTYSRSQYRETQEDDPYPINLGNWYNAPHDKPHNIKMALNYHFTHRFSFSANLDYSTGRPITIPIGYYKYGGKWRLAYSDRNSYRIPDYFRIDAAVNIEPSHYLRNLMHFSVTLGVYNVTGRKNAYSVYYTMKENNPVPQGYMLSVFACQIPYININISF